MNHNVFLKIIIVLVVFILFGVSISFYMFTTNYKNVKNDNFLEITERKTKINKIASDEYGLKTNSNTYYGYKINNKKNASTLLPVKTINIKFLESYYDIEDDKNNIEFKNRSAEHRRFKIIKNKELLRNNRGFYYSILRPNRKGFVFYSLRDGEIIDEAYIVKIPSKQKMIRILKVAKVDETAILSKKNQCYSWHRFDDGTMLEIEYSTNDWVDLRVKKWKWKNDPVNLINNILKKDYDLIK